MVAHHRLLNRLVPALLAASSTVVAVPVHAGPPPRRPPTKPVLQAPGELIVNSTTDGATLTIDGKVMGTVPLEDSIILLPGEHQLKLQLRGYKDYVGTITIAPGETFELEMDLVPWAGIVRIGANVEGATVKVDGKVEGVTPFDKDIPAGARTIIISHPDYKDEVRTLTLRATEVVNLDVVLQSLKDEPVAGGSGPEFYETWWFWTLIGVAGAGAATAAVVATGGESKPLTPNFAIQIP
jgi:hypothetical protein